MEPVIVKFWVVLCESGQLPVIKHESLELAKIEAERITRKQKAACYVLGLEATVKLNTPEPPITWMEIKQ